MFTIPSVPFIYSCITSPENLVESNNCFGFFFAHWVLETGWAQPNHSLVSAGRTTVYSQLRSALPLGFGCWGDGGDLGHTPLLTRQASQGSYM